MRAETWPMDHPRNLISTGLPSIQLKQSARSLDHALLDLNFSMASRISKVCLAHWNLVPNQRRFHLSRHNVKLIVVLEPFEFVPKSNQRPIDACKF